MKICNNASHNLYNSWSPENKIITFKRTHPNLNKLILKSTNKLNFHRLRFHISANFTKLNSNINVRRKISWQVFLNKPESFDINSVCFGTCYATPRQKLYTILKKYLLIVSILATTSTICLFLFPISLFLFQTWCGSGEMRPLNVCKLYLRHTWPSKVKPYSSYPFLKLGIETVPWLNQCHAQR